MSVVGVSRARSVDDKIAVWRAGEEGSLAREGRESG